MRRTREKQIDAMAKCWRMAIAGENQSEMARKLGISQGHVSRYLAKMRKVVSARLAEEISTYTMLSLAQTDHIFGKAMAAFAASAKPRRTVRRSDGTETITLLDREGDHAWIHEALLAIKLRMEILDAILPRNPRSDRGKPRNDPRIDDLAKALLEAEERNRSYAPGDSPA